MTTEEFADQYAREKGFPTGLNEMIMRSGVDVDEFIYDMLKAYALSVLPEKVKFGDDDIFLYRAVKLYIPCATTQNLESHGFNDCIDQIKKKIG